MLLTKTERGKLINDLLSVNPDDMNYEPLADRVKHFKRKPEEVREMAGYWDESIRIESEKLAQRMAKDIAQKEIKKEVKKAVKEAVKEQIKLQRESAALKMLQTGKLALEDIVAYTGLSMTAVKRLAKTLQAGQ